MSKKGSGVSTGRTSWNSRASCGVANCMPKGRQQVYRREGAGRFNSSTGQGKLYVLAHEQPKPAAEVLTWDQMADTASAHGNIVEVKDQKSITMPLQRGRLVEVLVSTYPGEDNHIHLTCPCMYYPQDGKWVGYVGARFSITANEKSTSLPLALANGCILFTTGSADFIIYPLGFDVDCP